MTTADFAMYQGHIARGLDHHYNYDKTRTANDKAQLVD